ncbi:MAG: AMP-binding protein, partial [bacterium]|nr:AMP-binding protein [bacterium]
FVNTLALRNYPSPSKTFDVFLNGVKQRTLDAFENQDYPFDNLVEKVFSKRAGHENPLFDAMFVLHNQAQVKRAGQSGENDADTYEAGALVALLLSATETGDHLSMHLVCRARLFKTRTMKQLAASFKEILSAIIGDRQIKLKDIDISYGQLTEEERKRILEDFNDTADGYTFTNNVRELFEAQVEQTPHHIALVYKEKQWSYRQLNRQANRIAQLLGTKGVTSNSIVG